MTPPLLPKLPPIPAVLRDHLDVHDPVVGSARGDGCELDEGEVAQIPFGLRELFGVIDVPLLEQKESPHGGGAGRDVEGIGRAEKPPGRGLLRREDVQRPDRDLTHAQRLGAGGGAGKQEKESRRRARKPAHPLAEQGRARKRKRVRHRGS